MARYYNIPSVYANFDGRMGLLNIQSSQEPACTEDMGTCRVGGGTQDLRDKYEQIAKDLCDRHAECAGYICFDRRAVTYLCWVFTAPINLRDSDILSDANGSFGNQYAMVKEGQVATITRKLPPTTALTITAGGTLIPTAVSTTAQPIASATTPLSSSPTSNPNTSQQSVITATNNNPNPQPTIFITTVGFTIPNLILGPSITTVLNPSTENSATTPTNTNQESTTGTTTTTKTDQDTSGKLIYFVGGFVIALIMIAVIVLGVVFIVSRGDQYRDRLQRKRETELEEAAIAKKHEETADGGQSLGQLPTQTDGGVVEVAGQRREGQADAPNNSEEEEGAGVERGMQASWTVPIAWPPPQEDEGADRRPESYRAESLKSTTTEDK
ncbi:hypothetical protein HDU97_008334 [Phlyctochytrium planicorne]|nr:hypothetical protein HDU97_008334 [Phlyctochytrium planicorne]